MKIWMDLTTATWGSFDEDSFVVGQVSSLEADALGNSSDEEIREFGEALKKREAEPLQSILIGYQVNTPLARTFRSIVTAGWANESEGNVEAPLGHFALVTIAPNELAELKDACLEDDDAVPYPGAYLVVEDSDGNTTVKEYLTDHLAKDAYAKLAYEYEFWLTSTEA